MSPRHARARATAAAAFLAHHSWQVFVDTPDGDVRLTAPGGG